MMMMNTVVGPTAPHPVNLTTSHTEHYLNPQASRTTTTVNTVLAHSATVAHRKPRATKRTAKKPKRPGYPHGADVGTGMM